MNYYDKKQLVEFLKRIDSKRKNGIPLNAEEISKSQELRNSIQGLSKQRFIKDLSESSGDKESDIETLLDDNIKRS